MSRNSGGQRKHNQILKQSHTLRSPTRQLFKPPQAPPFPGGSANAVPPPNRPPHYAVSLFATLESLQVLLIHQLLEAKN